MVKVQYDHAPGWKRRLLNNGVAEFVEKYSQSYIEKLEMPMSRSSEAYVEKSRISMSWIHYITKLKMALSWSHHMVNSKMDVSWSVFIIYREVICSKVKKIVSRSLQLSSQGYLSTSLKSIQQSGFHDII